MIGYLEGSVLAKLEGALLLRTSGGVGYQVYCPLPELADAATDQPLSLYITTVVRDTELTLYGFRRLEGKRLFELLIRAQGVGPKLALAFLSAFPPDELRNAILHNNVALLSSIPGVGRKTASRLCVELGDRLARHGGAAAEEAAGPHEDLMSALTNLGFPEKDVAYVVPQIATDGGDFAEQLKQALALLRRG